MKRTLPMKFSVCFAHDDEEKVQNGLAITPKDMLDLTSVGRAVSPQNLGIYYDEGYSDLDYTPPLEHRRGMCLERAWEESMNAKSKLRKYSSSSEFNTYQQPIDR